MFNQIANQTIVNKTLRGLIFSIIVCVYVWHWLIPYVLCDYGLKNLGVFRFTMHHVDFTVSKCHSTRSTGTGHTGSPSAPLLLPSLNITELLPIQYRIERWIVSYGM
jgi:hypothetical protein